MDVRSSEFRSRADPRAGSDLLVPEAIRGPVESEEIQALWLCARQTAADHDAIARPERRGRESDLDQFPTVVHLEPPWLYPAVGVSPGWCAVKNALKRSMHSSRVNFAAMLLSATGID